MSNSINLKKNDPIDYAKCYTKAKDKYENLFTQICELYLLSRALCEFADEIFDYAVCYKIINQRCIALYTNADVLLAEFLEDCFDNEL